MRKIEDNLNKTAVYFGDSASIDAFSRPRVSNPATIFDCQLTYDLQPLLLSQTISANGSITHNRTNRCASIALDNANEGEATFLQTFEFFRYQPGKSQLVFVTWNLGGGVDGVTKFAGYSDGENGFEFRIRDGVPEFVIHTTTEQGEQVVSQADWNLNRLDGKDIYSPTIDFTKTQILVIDFQALYVGRVCFGFDLDGVVVYCHEFDNANNTVFPYIATANLPVRAGMIANRDGVSAEMSYICCSVNSEGGSDDTIGYSFSTEQEVTVASATDTHMVSIQPRLLFNGFTNRIKFELESIDITVKGSNPIIWRLELGQALTDETVTDVNATYSGMNKVTGTLSGNGAIIITQGFVAATNQVRQSVSRNLINRYPLTLNPDGTFRLLGRLSIVARADNNNTLCKVILNWREIR